MLEHSDMESYLRSLEMKITFTPFNEKGRSRILQLISKSNQFNLTTKRYSQAEIQSIENNDNYFTSQIRLADIFGDNGMISLIICSKCGEIWEIDAWLMSCRVLGRRVEEAVLNYIVESAKKFGVKKLIGKYIYTERNKIVKEHYSKLGFIKVERQLSDVEFWELDIKSSVNLSNPIKVI